jgi:hypothetical protein
LRYYLIDTGSLSQVDLAMRDELPSLWFRMEKAANTAAMVAAVDARLAWLERHPGYADIRAVFADLLGDLIAPLGPELKVPEDLMEVRNMLATRAEQWVKQWQREGRRKGLAEGRQEGRREGLEEGRQEGRQEGEAALLLRLLERRFGTLPGWVMDRVRGAETGVLEEWGLRVLDARSIEDIFGAPPA